MSQPPIGSYERLPATVEPWDPRAPEVAAAVAALIHASRPDLRVEHIGSSAVPDLAGKGVIDLAIACPAEAIPSVVSLLRDLGFGPQTGPDPWPATRPMLVGSIVRGDASFRIHCHVQPGDDELRRDLAFRDALRADRSLARAYAALKASIVDGRPIDPLQYAYQKQAWIAQTLQAIGLGRQAIAPPATIGILGGGQLGRMLGLAARAMGYRVAVLDPDPECPAAAVADRLVVGAYDDVEAALRLSQLSDVVTYELEHVAVAVIEAIEERRPVRPGRMPLVVSQDRLAERRFIEAAGGEVAPWREVRSAADLHRAAGELGLPLRLKTTTGGYDGRGQRPVERSEEIDAALGQLGVTPGQPALVERELAFEAELSIVVARGTDGRTSAFPLGRNVHDRGVLVESVAPAPVEQEIAERALALGQRLAVAMGLVGTLTVELFLMSDGRLVVNELAPRVHN
ncbi:MAG: ATP-grasp domain-containing protein, partial [Candidatus Limnocylindrales bacterium]